MNYYYLLSPDGLKDLGVTGVLVVAATAVVWAIYNHYRYEKEDALNYEEKS
jgi:hypothetical protein